MKGIIVTVGFAWWLWNVMGPAGVVFSSPFIGMAIAHLLTREKKSDYY